jgi:hypothetical protein
MPTGVRRLDAIPGFNIDVIAAAAGDDPEMLRLENLDTDVAPPTAAVEATRAAVGSDEANSWLPFTGRDDLKDAVAASIERRGGPRYDGRREIVITSGEGDAMLDALFCLADPGDEVVLTDPTYAGMLNRVRLVGAVPRLVPLHVVAGEWRLEWSAPAGGERADTRRLLNNASFPSGWWRARTSRGRGGLCCERDPGSTGPGSKGCCSTAVGRPPRRARRMRDRTVTVGALSFEQRMIAYGSAGSWHRVASSTTSPACRSSTASCRAGSPRSARAL